MKERSTYIAQGALVAAFYVILTLISNLFGIANGVIQIRLSEALTILPIFIPAAVPGLFIGCLIANIITGCALFDIILGALATLVGAYGTYMLRNHRYLACLPPIIANTLIIPLVLSLIYNFEGSLMYFAVTIFIGEAVSAGALGELLAKALSPHTDRLGWNNANKKK